ncbi:MAG: hypothetical protein WCW35_02005 [Bacteroidota bacterium]|jgi:hypothetical protein
MSLYQYSETQIRMTGTPWTTAGSIFSGIILGSMLVFGILYWNHTSDRPVLFRPEFALAQENALLRHSVIELTYSLDGVDNQFQLLSSQNEGLTLLLRQPFTSVDSIARARYFPKQTDH